MTGKAAATPAAVSRAPVWTRRWRAAALPGLVVAAAALATGLDPYLSLASPWLAQAINAVGPVLLALVLFAVTGRWLLSLVAVAAVLGLLVFADATKQAILFNNLLYADFKILPDLVNQPGLVAGFVHPTTQQWMLGALALAVLLALAFWSFRRPAQPRVARLAAAIAAVAGLVAVETYPAPVQIPSLGWLLPMQIRGASQLGVTGNLLMGRMVAHDLLPDIDDRQVAAFWADPAVRAARARLASAPAAGIRPDIVFIQSESLFEPSLLCGFPDRPFLENVGMQAPANPQNLEVPVFGSRTLQTEFEVLSGFPVAFAPKSQFSYYELVDHPVNALPRYLAAQGYRTLALHPSVRSFWRRDYAIPAMGFATFIDGSAYFRDGDFSPAGWVNDAALVGTVVSELEAAQEPAFVFAISIANHGPWGEKPVADATGIELPSSLKGAARNELLDYLVRARAADRSYGALLRTLAARSRPTLVVFYGDHLPALTRTYDQLCFKDGKAPREHLPPLRVWANFPLRADVPERIPSHLLPGWTLRAAGLPMDGQFLAGAILAELRDDPAIAPAASQRLGTMYGHLAARAALANPVGAAPAGTILLPKRDASAVMAALQEGSAAANSGSAREGDLQFGLPLAPGRAQDTSFALSGRVAGAVLRPFLGLANDACLTNAEAGIADFEAWADGRRILSQRLHPNSVKLPYLDLAGVQRLTLRTRAPEGAGDCGRMSLRVSQMQCYSPACEAAPATARAVAASIPHVETLKDPLASDIGRSHYILRHLLGSQAPYTPIKLTPEKRIFLHPTSEKTAWLDVDVSELRLLELVPRIEPLDQACSANVQGGIVGVTVSVDGKVLATEAVDRNSTDVLSLPVDGKRMRIEVDVGNGVAWCDWFAMGFSRLVRRGRAPEALAAKVHAGTARSGWQASP